MRHLLVTAMCAWFPAVVMAQEVAPVSSRLPAVLSPIEVTPASDGFHMTDRVVFVIDISGSMRGQVNEPVQLPFGPPTTEEPTGPTKIEHAIASVLMIAGSTDDCQAAIFAFTNIHCRWPGCPEPCKHPINQKCDHRRCVLPGWARFPERLQEANDYMNSLVINGDTNPSDAIKSAMRLTTPDITVVLISDGDFDPDNPIQEIVEGRLWRTTHGLGDAPVLVFGVGSSARTKEALLKIAACGGGGFWVHNESGVTGPW